ncbi:MAG: choice-of-anchor L domain-containing protein, partial [Aphanizomenon gracile PMC644.10]|nr:choice-of-anchor L domain-containing protein [Aphanizomenon gracile PMC644.10]
GSVTWADYNGDGKQDFLLTGSTSSGGYISKLYKNTGNGFTEDTTVSLPGVSGSSVAWADYNGDGKQDFLLTGSTSSGYISKLYKNTGNGFTEDTTVSLPDVYGGSVAWADYNGDGKQEFLLTGATDISKLYKNTGNGFEEDINANKSDTNQAPTNITLNNSTIAENQPINTVVGNFTTIDPNTGDTFTYSLVSGTGDTDNNSFIIVGNNELQTKAVFDYETKNSYSIRVKTTDQGGLSFEKQLTIGVTDINETVANLSISPSNVTQTEGNLGNKPFTFTVTRTGDTTGTNSVNWSVNSPASFDDFANTTGTITFAPGEISKDIIVNVKGDLTQENNETFTVNLLSFNNNATITTATATGTITNDDLALATIQLPFPIKLIAKLPPKISQLTVGNLQIVGNYAYERKYDTYSNTSGLEIIDISDPTNPIIKGRWNYNITSGPVTSGYVYSVQVIGNYAYAASSRGLEIIDISNPTAPTLKGNYNDSVWNVSGFGRRVQVLNDYAYMAAGDSGLQIIDISNPSNPTLKGNYDTGYANNVQVIGNNAYVADVSGLQIIDISNPSNPTLKGNYNITDFTYDVQVARSYAYVSSGTGLRIIDISNPSNPSLQASYVTKREAYNVGLVDNYAYVSGDSGLEIIDISNPSSPTLKGYYNSSNMQVVGNYAYVAGTFGLQIIDITDITKAIPKGNYDTGNYAQSVQVVDNYAYVSASDAGLQIIDITDPTKPILKGNYDTPGYAHNVQLLGNYAYVADGLSGLQIIDISNATTPTLKGNYDTLGYAHDVQLLGNYAYVADGLSGLQIIDISDPSVPSLKENYNTPGDANDVQVVGNYAYVADGLSGLQIIDISDPTKPILKGNYKSTYQTYADNVRVVGNYAYLLYDYSGIEIIDISDPTKPTLKSKDDVSNGYDVQVIGNYAYVVNPREIKVIDVGDFTDTNQAPTNITLNNSTIAENQPINTKIGNFTTTDPNTANAFTYSLVSGTGDTDNDSFIIVGNNELQTKAVFDYETKNSYSVRVKTTDQGGLSFEKQLTIGVTDVNETPTNQAPTNISLNNSTIAENQPINTVVGNFTTTDPDAGNTFTYTLVSGTGDTDNNVFTITNNELKTNSGFDYESKNSYSIRVKTTDQGGLSFEKQLTIGVTDVNEVPVITSPTTANFAENGTGIVYTAIATDVDAGTAFTYSLSGTDASLFNISNGNVNFKNAPNFELPSDSGANNVYDLNVIASDGSLTATQAVAIAVTNVNEVPSNLTLSNSTIAENQAINTVVGNFTTIDPDEGDTFTYTLVSGTGDTDNNVFTITNNELKTNSGFDYETKNSYSIRVKTTDQGGLSFEKQLTIGVTDVNEPVANLSISPSNVTQTEGNSGTKAFTFTVTRSEDTSGSSSANWAVTGSGTNQADVTDFGGTFPTSTVVFAAGETTKTIIVDVLGDTTVEPDEGFTVTLSNPTNATITTATAVGTIENDDDVALVLVSQILGSGVTTVKDAKFTGSSQAVDTFTNSSVGIGITSGIVLSSGKVADIYGNNVDNISTDFSGAGDADLNKLVNGSTEDAAVLEFDFIPTDSFVSFDYVFASEEYKEYVNSQYNDVFGFFVTDTSGITTNIAVIPGTQTPITVNNINDQKNANLYRDNPQSGSGSTYNTKFDGFTSVLTATTPVKPGETYKFKLALADTADSALDSAIFIGKGFSSSSLVASNDSFLVTSASQASFDVLKNDFVSSGKPVILDFNSVSDKGGKVSRDNNQTPTDLSDDKLLYTPPLDFNGIDTFQYTLGDGQNGTATGKVSIEVKNISLAIASTNATQTEG